MSETRFPNSPIDAHGSAANIYAIASTATLMLRRAGVDKAEIEKLRERISAAPTYLAAIEIVREFFPVNLED